jgi:endonuclease/exonuclease/phosphatase family metal-dependent hydrolase
MKKILKFLIYTVILFVVAFAFFLIYASVNDFQAEEKMLLYESDKVELINDTTIFNLLIWNIGYCGLNKEMDFFYDGGKNVRPAEDKVINNLQEVKNILTDYKQSDFILLQEVDKESKRSYFINQFDTIASLFSMSSSIYGKNYDVFFVPTPPAEPMGKVNSGLMSISKFDPVKSVRYSLPGNYEWPMKLFMLDRCFLVNRYNLSNDKELLIINTHNSAYDDGTLKRQQMEYLKVFLTEEYEKGNYIVVGGDWNQCPPEFEPAFQDDKMDNEVRTDISTDYLQNWTWLFDRTIPTNRRVSKPYKKGETLTTVIDFYLLSPNIEPVSIKTIDIGFVPSDHQPVEAIIKLK